MILYGSPSVSVKATVFVNHPLKDAGRAARASVDTEQRDGVIMYKYSSAA